MVFLICFYAFKKIYKESKQNFLDLLLTYEFNLKNDQDALNLCLSSLSKYFFPNKIYYF